MPVLRTIKSEYEFYYNEPLELFVALDSENSKALSTFWKENKGKQKQALPGTRVTGFKLIFDEEFQSLKIDFDQTFQFNMKDLQRTKLA